MVLLMKVEEEQDWQTACPGVATDHCGKERAEPESTLPTPLGMLCS